MPPVSGSYNWTQVAAEEEDDWADRMSREALMFVCGLDEEDWESVRSGEADIREFLDSDTAAAVAEIEHETGLTLKFRDADVGRGASGFGAAVEIIGAVAVVGGAAAAVEQSARLVKWAYHKIASATGGRPWVSLGAAEHLAMADLIDRVDAEPRLLGSGDMNSNNVDRAFTGGDAFFVVLATDSELHHYHVSAYGEVHYIGTSPPIPHHWDDPPPYWSGGDMDDNAPTLICYPFLRVDSPIAVGPWRVVPLFGGSNVFDPVPAYGDGPDDSWASDAFRESAIDFLKRFYWTHSPLRRQRIEHPSIVVKHETGADGDPPTESERTALTTAVTFAALDTNPYRSETKLQHLRDAVSEHLDYWEIPLADDGMVSEDIGFRVRSRHACTFNDDRFGKYRVFAPRCMPEPPIVSPNRFLASAMHRAVAASTEASLQLATAVLWWAKSWSNQDGIEVEERIVMCGTAFEAVLGSPSNSRQARTELNGLFERAHAIWGGPDYREEAARLRERREEKAAAGESVDDAPDGEWGMLWHPDTSDQLCAWHMAFSELRNNCAHRGDILRDKADTVGEALSAYEELSDPVCPNPYCDSPAEDRLGNSRPVAIRVLDDAERILREAIKAKLIICNDDPNTDQDTRSCEAKSIISRSFAEIYEAAKATGYFDVHP